VSGSFRVSEGKGTYEEPDGGDDDKGRDALDDERNAPGEIALNALSSKDDTGSGDATSEPSTVVEAGHATTPLRRADLDTVTGGSGCHECNTETEDETSADELLVTMRAGDDGFNSDDRQYRNFQLGGFGASYQFRGR
jgi:hypothetical protein